MKKVRRVLRTRHTARILSPGIPDVYIGQEMRVAPIDRPGIRVQGRASRVSEAAPVSRVTSYYHTRVLNMRAINVKLVVGLFKVIRTVCIDTCVSGARRKSNSHNATRDALLF